MGTSRASLGDLLAKVRLELFPAILRPDEFHPDATAIPFSPIPTLLQRSSAF